MQDYKYSKTAKIAFVIACISLVISLYTYLSREKPTNLSRDIHVAGILDRINQNNEIHAGYGVYPPYSFEDPNTQKVTGYSVDIIEHIAKELNCKVIWHRINWDTMSADLKRGEFDVIADPIYQTIPRAPEFAFSDPYAFFADGIAVVKIDDNRFKKFEDLDKRGIKIAVGLGQASEALVRSRFKSADIEPVSAGTDNMHIFAGLLSGRVDVAVADGANAERFVNEHSSEVKALWIDNPPAYMPAGFALRPSDSKGAEFLSVCLRNLQTTGVLKSFAIKYHMTLVKLVQ